MDKKNLKDYIGKTLYYIDEDKNVKPFEVQFINENSALSIIDDECIVKNSSDLYKTEEEAKANRNGNLVIFCREVCRTTGDVVFYIVSKDGVKDSYLFNVLPIRSRMNMELTYYVSLERNIDENILKGMDDDTLQELIEQDAVIEIDEVFNRTVKRGNC